MKKTVLKLAGTMLLVAAIVITQIPASGSNATSISTNNGFMMDGDKLVKYTGTATSVSVPDGVKVIGAEAFAENTALSYVTFPDSLRQIENGAFSGCTYLNRIIVPEGCESIGNGAFADCENLSSVTLPASLTELGTSVFAGCDDLASIGIEKGNTHFVCEDGVLYDDEKKVIYQVLAGREKATYSMPNTVEEIKKYAFWGCDNLQEVGVSSNLNRIDDYAFSNASGLQAVTLPYSVRSIGTKAFEDCRNLEDVTIPVSVTQIDSTAFDGCYRLKIIADEGTAAADFYATFEQSNAAKTEYEESVSANNPHWQADQTKTEETTETKTNVSDVDNYVEWDVDSPGVLGRTKVVSRQAVILMDSSAGKVYSGAGQSSDSSISEDTAVQEEEQTEADIQAVVNGNAIVNKAFYRDDTLLSFQIPSGVEEIGDFAFARSGLTSIQIPNGVTKIGNGAFYHCDQLSTVSIPSTVTEIEPDAFANTKWLENWYAGADVSDFLVVGNGILLAYKGNDAVVTLPSNVKTVAPGVFRDHQEITQVNLPDCIKTIGEEAFEGCTNLKNISGGSGLQQIKDKAFYECPIETVRIPASVESIGLMAFGGSGQTDSIVFLGSAIPKVTYEKSATRLSNDRGLCFTDITTAVVPAQVRASELENTVLDAACLGFEGVVYTLSENSNEATAQVLKTTEASQKVPESISVYGKRYTTQTTEATEYAEAEETVSDNSIQGRMVVDHDELKGADITVAANGSTVNLDGYHFYVSNPGLGAADLEEKITETFGTVNEDNCFMMDLSLYDPTDTIPISKLGKTPLTITMPVPAELLDDEICLISLDENGNPEVTFCTWLEKDDKKYISFDIEHFSPYALYGAQGELKEQITEKRSMATYASGLDDTPDTGDYLNIRVILMIGLAALGGFLLLAGFSKKSFQKK
jgi:hypothetical protein